MAKQKWFTTEAAAPLLGKKNGEAVRYWLRKGRKEGWLKLDVHYRQSSNPDAGRPTWEINVEACNDRTTTRRRA